MRRLCQATSPSTLLYVTVELYELTPYTEYNYHDEFCAIISSLQEKGSLQSNWFTPHVSFSSISVSVATCNFWIGSYYFNCPPVVCGETESY